MDRARSFAWPRQPPPVERSRTAFRPELLQVAGESPRRQHPARAPVGSRSQRPWALTWSATPGEWSVSHERVRTFSAGPSTESATAVDVVLVDGSDIDLVREGHQRLVAVQSPGFKHGVTEQGGDRGV